MTMPTTIAKGEFHLLVGPASLTVKSGAVEIIAARVLAGQSVQVPEGKKVPILGLETSELDVEAPPDGLTKMEASSIPDQWDELAQRIAKAKKPGELYTVMVFGEVDTGKTFFSTYLANRLTATSGKIAILDCDTGQSDIGAPGTFGMLVLDGPAIFLTELPPTHMTLLGAHSPGLHFLPTVTGLTHMMRKAKQEADVLIIDTTGWVQGDGGRAVKKAKLDIVQPDMVVLMQRSTELEHLVRHLPGNLIARLPVSKKASPTDQMVRKGLRERVSKKYFERARMIEIPFDRVFTDRVYFRTGTPLNLEGTLHAERLSGWEGTFVVTSGPLIPEITKNWPTDLGMIRTFIAGEEKGLMVALLNIAQDVLAIGRLEEMDFLNNRFRIRTNFTGDLDSIKGIQFGSLKLTEKGEEAGFLEPGTL